MSRNFLGSVGHHPDFSKKAECRSHEVPSTRNFRQTEQITADGTEGGGGEKGAFSSAKESPHLWLLEGGPEGPPQP